MTEDQQVDPSRDEIMRMAADIVASYVTKNKLDVGQIPDIINNVYNTLVSLNGAAYSKDALTPPVPIRKSITPDFIVCLEDGKKLKMLKRHLKTSYGLTPDEYRERWGLPSDYPMVAPNYASQRSALAKKIGLGTKPRKRVRKRKA